MGYSSLGYETCRLSSILKQKSAIATYFWIAFCRIYVSTNLLLTQHAASSSKPSLCISKTSRRCSSWKWTISQMRGNSLELWWFRGLFRRSQVIQWLTLLHYHTYPLHVCGTGHSFSFFSFLIAYKFRERFRDETPMHSSKKTRRVIQR